MEFFFLILGKICDFEDVSEIVAASVMKVICNVVLHLLSKTMTNNSEVYSHSLNWWSFGKTINTVGRI